MDGSATVALAGCVCSDIAIGEHICCTPAHLAADSNLLAMRTRLLVSFLLEKAEPGAGGVGGGWITYIPAQPKMVAQQTRVAKNHAK